jgi:dsDNA-specific endonuclease/ATPase MutS2
MKIGDKVSVLDEVISGEVTAISKNKITIIDSDGFEYQYLEKELVYDSNDFSDLTISLQNISEIISEKEQKKNKNIPKVKSKDRSLPPMEVDLHIQQLVPKTRGLDNFEMLNIQLDTARYKITFAISKRIQRIVFIHGVGEGVLRYELHRLLKEYEGQLKFYDADYQKYGIGATEVYLFQNKK